MHDNKHNRKAPNAFAALKGKIHTTTARRPALKPAHRQHKGPDIRQLINKFGYEGAKRKLRMTGMPKAEVFRRCDFLFKEV